MILKLFIPKNLAFLLIGLILSLSLILIPANGVNAQISDNSKTAACEGLQGSGQPCDGTAKKAVSGLLSTVINVLSWIVGIASVIMVIVGGLKFVLSNGDSNGVASARSTIIYALVGLAVAAVAQLLVRFVLQRVSNV